MLKILRVITLILTFILPAIAQEADLETSTQKELIDFKKPLKFCGIFESPQIEENSIASDNENVFIPLTNGEIISIDKISRNIKWKTDLGGKLIKAPLVYGRHLITLSVIYDKNEANLSIRLLNKENGLVIWQNGIKEVDDKVFQEVSPSNNKDLTSLFPRKDEIILVRKNNILLINLYDGKIIKRKQIQEKITTNHFVDETKIVFGTDQKNIFVVSVKDFTEIKKLKIASKPIIIHSSANGLIWGDEIGSLFKIGNDSSTRKSRKIFRAGGNILSISSFEANYLITSLDNFAYYISGYDGDIIWKRRLPNRPENKPLIIGSDVIIQSVGDSPIWVLDLNSGSIVNRINLESENFFTGEVLHSQPYLLLQTKKGILFHSYKGSCL